LLAFGLADTTESVIRGDHYGQSNDWQKIWRQGCEQTRREEDRGEEARCQEGRQEACQEGSEEVGEEVEEVSDAFFPKGPS